MVDLWGPDNPGRMTGEQWVLETRTDDPASPEPDERWIRTDIDDGDRVATLMCGDGTEIPLFPTGLAEEGVSEAVRFEIGGETVFAPIAPIEGAAFLERRVQHDNELHAFHNEIKPIAIRDPLAYGSQDDNVYVHDTPDWSLRETLSESGDTVQSVTFSPDGEQIAYGSRDDNVYVHDTSDWGSSETLTEAGGIVWSVTFSPDGSQIAYGSQDANVYLHDTSDWSLQETLTESGSSPYSVTFSPDGSQIAYGSQDANVYLHDTSDWSLQETLTEAGASVWSVTFLPV